MSSISVSSVDFDVDFLALGNSDSNFSDFTGDFADDVFSLLENRCKPLFLFEIANSSACNSSSFASPPRSACKPYMFLVVVEAYSS